MYTWCFLLIIAVASFVHVQAAACEDICYTTELKGFGPGGSPGCSCSGDQQGARVGSGDCSCGQCYTTSGSGILGYALNTDGTCTFGTDCGDCDYSSNDTSTTMSPTTSPTTSPSSSSSTTESPTDTPSDTPPAASTPTSSSPPSPGTSSTDSSNTNPSNTTGSVSADTVKSSNSLETWQIALIICCGVLVFTVAVVAVLSCYCKARNRLLEHENDEVDANYYQQQHRPLREDAFGSSIASTPAFFPRPPSSASRSGSTGGFTNEQKPLYANPANSGISDGHKVGLTPVRARHSSDDVAGFSGRLSQGQNLSGSHLTELRSSCGSRAQEHCAHFEQRYNTARERELLSVDL